MSSPVHANVSKKMGTITQRANNAVIKIALSEFPDAEEFDLEVSKAYEKAFPKELQIDFSSVRYIEIATLMNIIALILERNSTTSKTFFVLPRNYRVRDFMKVWRFPEALEAATSSSFLSLLTDSDRILWSEPQRTFSGIGSGLNALEFDPDWNGSTNSKRNFFEFTSFKEVTGNPIAQDGSNAEIPRKESQRWASPLVTQVLSNHLFNNNRCHEVARVVIYEALSNCVRHPDATILQCCSRFHTPTTEIKPSGVIPTARRKTKGLSSKLTGTLQICIWDNGRTIAETLLDVVNKGLPVRTETLPQYMCDSIFVTFKTLREEIKGTHRFNQSETLTKENAKESVALLSSLFPGISRAPKSLADSNVGSDELTGEYLSRPPVFGVPQAGMGLYALMRTALDQFQGSLTIRSGALRLHLELAHDTYRVRYQSRYKGTITQYPGTFPKFHGNLVRVVLPLRDVTQT